MFDRFSIHHLLQTFVNHLVSQLRAKPDPPLILKIDGRLEAVTSPEEISKALCDAVVAESLMGRAQSTLGALEVGVQLGGNIFAKDEKNLAETLRKLDLFEKLKDLPKKPVIIIGKTTARPRCSKIRHEE